MNIIEKLTSEHEKHLQNTGLLRLDQMIVSQTMLSRKDVKKKVLQSKVLINGEALKDPSIKINPLETVVFFDGREIKYKKHVYFLMNKPIGVLSASSDKKETTVINLLDDKDLRPGLFPAGRLDKDTTGLVIVTDDGDFAHYILSPKNEIEKTYVASLEKPFSPEDIHAFESGITLADGFNCLPAKIKILDEDGFLIQISIVEGKYHQIKRMVASTSNFVSKLHRISIGELKLSEMLRNGEYTEISFNHTVHGAQNVDIFCGK